jgi:hypothetical protein
MTAEWAFHAGLNLVDASEFGRRTNRWVSAPARVRRILFRPIAPATHCEPLASGSAAQFIRETVLRNSSSIVIVRVVLPGGPLKLLPIATAQQKASHD